MKKIITVCFLLLEIIFLLTACQQKTLTKNTNTGVVMDESNNPVLSADEVVPPLAELIANLENEGYKITECDKAFGSEINAGRIYAEKNGKFIDICYGLSVEDAKNIFLNYEAEYTEFYLMAQNEGYVYVVSDKQTFKKAGFNSTATLGTIYIWD